MVLEIIGFILAILGVILFIMSYSDEGDDSIRCCCGLILVIFVTYLYGHFGIIGRVIILLVLYSLYFANEPEKLSKIIDTIDKFINWIDSLSKKVQAGKIVGDIARALGGNGGGKPQYAQGMGKVQQGLDDILLKIQEDILNTLK